MNRWLFPPPVEFGPRRQDDGASKLQPWCCCSRRGTSGFARVGQRLSEPAADWLAVARARAVTTQGFVAVTSARSVWQTRTLQSVESRRVRGDSEGSPWTLNNLSGLRHLKVPEEVQRPASHPGRRREEWARGPGLCAPAQNGTVARERPGGPSVGGPRRTRLVTPEGSGERGEGGARRDGRALPDHDPPAAGAPRHGARGGVCSQGVGGSVAGHSSRRASRLAEGQRLPAARTQTSHAVVPGLFPEHLPDPHGDGQHLDPPAGLPLLPGSGSDVHVPTQHVLRGSSPGEGGDRRVLPGRHPLPVLLLALPHRLLPLRGRLQGLLQAGLQRHRLPHHGLLRSLALLLLLLLTSALLHLPDGHLRPGPGRHHRVAVRLLRHAAVPRSASRCVRGPGPERRGPHAALCDQRGSDQGHHHRPDGLAAADGHALHHRRRPLRRPHPREVLPGQVRHLVSLSPALPHPGRRRGLRPLPRSLQPAGVPLHRGRRLRRGGRRLRPALEAGAPAAFRLF